MKLKSREKHLNGADQEKALADIRGQEEGERGAHHQQRQLLAERRFRLRAGNQAVPAIDGRPPKSFHRYRPRRQSGGQNRRLDLLSLFMGPARVCIRLLP